MITVTKQTRAVVLAGLMLAAWHGSAAAQTDDQQVYVNLNLGGQAHSHTLSITGSQSVYGETATFESTQGVSGGLLVDFGGAYRVMPNLAIGASFSTVSDTEDATLVASIPHPIFFDQHATVTGAQGNLGHRETAFHIQAKLTIPTGAWLPTGSWVALVVGPSFFNLSQDLISSITVPGGTQTVVPVVEEQTASGAGINAGFEGRYPVTPNVGIGGFIRYAGGKVDLDSVQDVKVGGFQAAIGVSLGF